MPCIRCPARQCTRIRMGRGGADHHRPCRGDERIKVKPRTLTTEQHPQNCLAGQGLARVRLEPLARRIRLQTKPLAAAMPNLAERLGYITRAGWSRASEENPS